ncbi:hypothetical protein G7Y79_00005g017260 [Physcia stellaris]|nr:hypothetical protein G7Y79_00005g017260 [Physcia stellaris]
MAAPPRKTLHNIAGRWTLNKDLSDPFEPVLKLQGVNGFIRKLASHTSVHLNITQPTPNEIHLQQTATGASIPAVTEDWILDWQWRDGKDPLFGDMTGRARWIKKEEAPEGDWEDCDDGLIMQAEGKKPDDEWGGTHYWGFEYVGGERRYTRRIYMVNNKTTEKMNVRMVYNFDGE